MNLLLSPQPPPLHLHYDTSRFPPQPPVSPISGMACRKRKADEDGDEAMSPMSSPAVSSRQLVRPSKKMRAQDAAARPLPLTRLLEILDADQLRSVLGRICHRHAHLAQEVVSDSPRPAVSSVLDVLQAYLDKMKAAMPYGHSSPEYTYYRIKDALLALIQALSDFTPQFLPPTESQSSHSLQYLDGATKLIHQLPDWESPAYRHHKDHAYDEISKAWILTIHEAGKRGGGINLHSGGWDQTLSRHNQQSGGRLQAAATAMSDTVGWIAPEQPPNTLDQGSILGQLISGTYGSPVRVGPW